MESSTAVHGEEVGRYTAVHSCSARVWQTGCSTWKKSPVSLQRRPLQPNSSHYTNKAANLQLSISGLTYHIMAGDVEEILEVLVPAAEQGPNRAGALVDVPRLPLTSVVAQEGAVKTRVRVLH